MSSLSELNFADTADSGATLTVLHPVNGTPLKALDGENITITLYGIDSDVYVKANNASRDQSVEELRRRAKFSSSADGYRGSKILAKCTIGWHGVPKTWLGGEQGDDEVPYSYDNALALYNNRGVKWLRDQVDEFIADRSNFLKASSSNSSVSLRPSN